MQRRQADPPPPALAALIRGRVAAVVPQPSASPAQAEAESERMRASHEADKAELVTARRMLWAAQEAERFERDSSEDDAEEQEAAALRADVERLTGELQQAEADAAADVDSSADPSPVPSSGSAHSGTAPVNTLGVAQRTLSFGRAFGRKARPDAVQQQQQQQANTSAALAPPAPESDAAPARTQSFGRRGARAALGAASLLSRSVSRKASSNATSETTA